MSGDDRDDDTNSLLAKIAGTSRRHAPLHLVGTKRFELRKKLGTGAFGDVYEARDREHGSVVALKTLKSSHPDWIFRFKREFRIVGDLSHPNLVRMFELFVEDDRWYLTMELIDGVRFDDHVRRAPATLRSSFGQLALGLSALHRAGCLHRDVKPSNALVESTGQVVLLDFGLAVNQHAALASAIAGTAPYMAPELGLRQPPTEASDWYAFGVMLYEALAGELPFPGDEAEMLRAKLLEDPPPPSDLRTGVEPALEKLALRLLAREPAARPTAAEILSELVTRGPFAAARDRAPADSIVGRRDQLAVLDAAFEASRHRPVVVSVSGPPGIGKSALVGAFVDPLRARQVPVFQGRCLELESVPLKGLDAAIDELCNDLCRRRLTNVETLAPSDVSALAHVFPMVKRVEALARRLPAEPDDRSPRELRQAGARVLRELFGTLGPLVLFIDDLQWTGEDSIDLLLELLSSPSMLLVVAHRSAGDRRAPIVDRFMTELTTRGTSPISIEVPPLDPADVGAWIEASGVTPMSTEHAVRETGGHPYLLSRLFLYESSAADQPIGLAAVLERALVELDANERRLVDVVAIAGGPTSPHALFAAAGLPYDPAAIDQLRRRKLIQSEATADGPRLDTFHDRVRETVLAATPADRRRELEVQLTTVLGAIADPPET